MNSALPAIDAHAHVEPTVSAQDLASLGCAVVAVTRESAEWGPVRRRTDGMTIWGIGCHPGHQSEIDSFDQLRFAEAIEGMPLVGEIGLDFRGGRPRGPQQKVFREILEVTRDSPRILSIHSVNAAGAVLDALEEAPQSAAILHWWRGTERQTSRALDLNCYFSVNGAEVRNPKILMSLPPDRVLTETDFPFTEKADLKANRPGAVSTTETALAKAWNVDRIGVRSRIWANLRDLAMRSSCADLLPDGILRTILALPTPQS
jgi:TatD DNase family protein